MASFVKTTPLSFQYYPKKKIKQKNTIADKLLKNAKNDFKYAAVAYYHKFFESISNVSQRTSETLTTRFLIENFLMLRR